jgi:hypothetical protein
VEALEEQSGLADAGLSDHAHSLAVALQGLLKPEFAVHRHLRTRNPCIDGVSFPKRLKIHRYMNRVILLDTKPIEL